MLVAKLFAENKIENPIDKAINDLRKPHFGVRGEIIIFPPGTYRSERQRLNIRLLLECT